MNDNEIAQLYESGLTIKQVAEMIGKSYESTRQILKKQNVKWRKTYVSDLTSEQIKNIIERYQNNETIKKIAAWYEISPSAISKLLKSKGIEVEYIGKKYDILREIPINKIQKELIVGTLLGDGCLYKDNKNSNFKLSFGHQEKHEQYFHWKVAMLDPFINNYRKSIDKRGNSTMLQTATITHKDLNYLGNLFYTKDRKKIIPQNLDMFFTPLALAVWIQDDGNLNEGVNMRICSQGFSKDDNYRLQDYLVRCFDIRSNVIEYKMKGKLYYSININKKNTQKLSDIIREHVVDCMKYKLMPEPSTTSC